MNHRLTGIPATIALIASLSLAPLPGADVPIGIEIPPARANAADLARFTKNTDITPRVVAFAVNWPPDPAAFPVEKIETIAASGAQPAITWMLPGSNAALESIAHGDWDAKARETAGIVRAGSETLWMRLAVRRGDGAITPDLYQRAFRRIVEIFRTGDAANARWLFVADVTPIDGPEAPLGMDAFPGADIVDLVGMRGLNWGTTRTSAIHGWDSEWRTFRQIFEERRAKWETLAAGKPIVAITATASIGGRKSDWVLDAVRTAAEWKLAALVWFQEADQINWAIQECIPREIMMDVQTMNEPLANGK